MKKKAREKQENWLFLKEKDEYTKTDDGISEFTTSIRTGRTMAEIEEGEEFIYAGRAGTGLTEVDMKELAEKFADIKRMDSPFKLAPKARPASTRSILVQAVKESSPSLFPTVMEKQKITSISRT